MLASLKEVLEIAEKENYAVGAFNTPNLENLLAVIRNAEELKVPVIISHAQLHEEIAPLSDIGPVMVYMAKEANVPVCVHLDHGETFEYLETALKIGFTGIMYDGSVLPYEENLANTNARVDAIMQKIKDFEDNGVPLIFEEDEEPVNQTVNQENE